MCSLKVCLVFVAAVIAISCISSTNAAVFTQPAAFHPAHPGKCFDKITRRAMLPNKEYKPKGICAVMTCDIFRQTINIETCPYVEMPGCEELPSDPNWAFPKCCAQFKCMDFKTGKEFIVSA
uniref:Cyclic AMP-responsive element-binding protein 3-like protein 3 n=1 Tax=Zeugodacus cucurbitae TaxID=28588 RepID=A0A0A1X1M5_ZEUCU